MAVSISEVEKIAALSKLAFSAEQIERFRNQFQEILEYVSQLEAVPTEEIAPTYHTLAEERGQTPMREDEVRPCFSVQEALSNSPDPAEDHFRVPKVLE